MGIEIIKLLPVESLQELHLRRAAVDKAHAGWMAFATQSSESCMKGFNREIRSGVTVRVYKFYVFHDILYMYVFEIYTHMFKHVQRSQFTPHFDQGGLDTEVDLLLQQLEDRLCVLVRGHIKP